MRELRGKVAVVTGAASGIGRALAEAFLGEGMKVVLSDIEQTALDKTTEELRRAGGDVLPVRTDVADASQVDALAQKTIAHFGAVHVVCNNAGVAPIAKILDTSLEDWRWLVSVNLMGVVHGISTFGPLLVKQGDGHIVNTASAAALLAPPGLGPYAATKHALLGLTETLYYELAGTGVGASVLCPFLVQTQIFQSERNRPKDGGPTSYGRRQQLATDMIQTGGIPPTDVARAVVDAIYADKLFVLVPHDQLAPFAEARFKVITSGENPPDRNAPGLPE